jgi:hypothetical protein
MLADQGKAKPFPPRHRDTENIKKLTADLQRMTLMGSPSSRDIATSSEKFRNKISKAAVAHE